MRSSYCAGTCFLYLLLVLAAVAVQLGAAQVVEPCVHCATYVDATAAEKHTILMDKIVASEYTNLPSIKGSCDVDYDWKNTIDFNNQFDRFSDERPAGFARFFHLQTIVAAVKFDTTTDTDHDFTGIFRGAEHGTLSFSPLAPVLTTGFLVNNILGSFFYSFALKLLRDGMHSANILTGEQDFARYRDRSFFWDLPDFNIFSRPVSNLSGLDRNAPLFGKNEKFAGILSQADSAAYDTAGNEESDPKTPYMVLFEPNPKFKEQFGRVGEIDFRKWLNDNVDSFQPGEILYTGYTTVDKVSGEATLCVDDTGKPQANNEDVETFCPDQKVIKLGDVILTSRFYASKWADDKLFYQHTRFCPKDQSVCENVTPDQSPAQPIPSFAKFGTESTICLSDDDKDGVVSGDAPACPDGSTSVGGYCFPGNHRKVEATQIAQCPFLNVIDPFILGTDEDVAPSDSDCSKFGQFGTNTFTKILGGVSKVLRFTTGLWKW